MEKLQPVHSEGILARIRESTNHYAVTEHLEKKSILSRCHSNCNVPSYRLLLLLHPPRARTPWRRDDSI